MANLCPPARNSVAAQIEMFRLAERDHGLSVRYLASSTPIPLSTLKGWSLGTVMPFWAVGILKDAGFPDDLLSMPIEAHGVHIGSDGEGEGAWNDAAQAALAYAAAVNDAQSVTGPGKQAIVPQEQETLRVKARRAASLLRKAARAS